MHNPKWLEMLSYNNRLRIRIQDCSAGNWKYLSVNPAVDGSLQSLSGSKEREIGSHFMFFAKNTVGLWPPTAHYSH